MNSLPDEILLHIFKYIPPRDFRNSIRLVCLRWYQLAGDKTFTNDELVVVNCKFRNRCCWSHKRKLQRNLSHFFLDDRSIINLFFKNQQCHQQDKPTQQFWSFCGDRVRSLIFQGCELTFADLRGLILWCPNVEHISLLWSNPSNSDQWIRSVPYYSMYRVQSVTSFSIQLFPSGDRELSYKTILRILSTFPNLEELKIVVDSKYNYHDDVFHEHQISLMPVNTTPLSAIAYYMQMQKKKLKKLWLVQANSIPREETKGFSSALSELENLEELTITGHQFLCKMPCSTALWRSLPKLTFLSLSRIPISNIRENILLAEILDAMPNLQVLHFESDRSRFFSSLFNENLVEKILSSRLKGLHLIHYDSCFCGLKGKWMGVDDVRLNTNDTLEELAIICKSRISEYRRHIRVVNLILQHCKKLRYLAISHPHDQVLQSIFKYHKSLKSLMLLRAEICSDFGFTGRSPSKNGANNKKTYCINELENLEQLTIRKMDLDRVSYRMSPFFALPKLKSLEMDFVKDCCTHTHKPKFMKDLIRAISQNVLLETLQFHFCIASDLPENLLKQLLIPLKDLRFFSLTFELENDSFQQTSIIAMIRDSFAVCPSLRFLVYGKRIFLRHRTPTNEFDVKEVSPSCLKFDKPREMLPNWYNLCKSQPEMWSNLDQIEFD